MAAGHVLRAAQWHAKYLWEGFAVNKKLWLELGYTVAGTLISFLLGSSAALALGLLFVMFPKI